MIKTFKYWIFLLGAAACVCFSLYSSAFASETPVPVFDYPKPSIPDDASPALREKIKRGEYVAKMSDCVACHSVVGGQVYGGGTAFKTPFGTFYSPNISPDPVRGIGKWTEREFIRAMRLGFSPGYKNYFPVFPYLYFNRMTEEDLSDVYAYLMHVPKVQQENRKHDVMFPFGMRFFQHGWKMMFFYLQSGLLKEDPTQSKVWHRGRYLVEGPGHCAMCHSPINFLGGPKKKYHLSGGSLEVDGYLAPGINKAGIHAFSDEQVFNMLKKGEMPGGVKLRGGMMELVQNSLRYLSDDDLKAIVFYLRTVESKPLPPKKLSGPKTKHEKGMKVYEAYCAVCHTTGAAGAPKIGVAADWVKRLEGGMPMLMAHAWDGYRAMPAKGGCATCGREDIDDSVLYLLEQSSGPEGEKNLPGLAPKPALTFEDGRKIYETYCALCHTDGKIGATKLGDKAAWQKHIRDVGVPMLLRQTLLSHGGVSRGSDRLDNESVIAASLYLLQTSDPDLRLELWLRSKR